MRSYSPAVQAALEAGRLKLRRSIWCTVRNRSTDAPYSEGYWSETYSRELTVFDPATGSNSTRTYYGAGTLIEMDPLPRTATLQVKRPSVRFSQVNPRVDELFRDYDAKHAPVEVHTILFDPDTGEQVEAGEVEFIGRVNELVVNQPAAGEPGSVEFKLVSRLQEINRKFSSTRSGADQKRERNAADTFHDDNEVAAEFDLPWGTDG
jgi:hypothetical protein